MPSSDKRIAANRANATRSTGPRTPEGKHKSSLNAVKHGLTAQSSVLPGEDPEHLEALSNSFMKQLKPRGVVQRIIAERIVSITWKLRRVARAEEAVAREMRARGGEDRLGRKLNRFDGASMLAESIRDKGECYLAEEHDTRLTRLTDYELKLDSALRGGMRELLKLQKDARAFEEVEEEEENEPTVAPGDGETPEDRDGKKEDDPGLGSFVAAPAACGDGREAPGDKTNPLSDGEVSAQAEGRMDVMPDLPTGSSAPVPGTSASPPPGRRR